ncbi:MAG: class IV adenylate cyclase [Candidatus Acidiferrales bacterium]
MATKLETEIKLRVDNLLNLIRQLRRIGARDHGRAFEQNTLYDTPRRDFHRHDRLIRLRVEIAKDGRRKAKLTSKARPDRAESDSKSKKSARLHKAKLEREADVRDPASTARLLEKVGLHPSFRYEKYRTSFRLGSLHLDVDETPIGTFLELEGPPAAIDRAARKLGYPPAEYIRGTYWDLYAADCRRRRQKSTDMIFSPKNGR